ncbi:MAG: hybrid sensor histidine kinase/response regulator [bacterium]
MDKHDDFFAQLLATFRIEANEHIAAMSAGLLALEKTPASDERKNLIETVYRAVHSLKGASRAVDLTNIEMLCQAAESVFAAIKREEINFSPELFDTLHRVTDVINSLLSGRSDLQENSILSLQQELSDLKTGGSQQSVAKDAIDVTQYPTTSELETSEIVVNPPIPDNSPAVEINLPPKSKADADDKNIAKPVAARESEIKTDFTGTIRVAADRLDIVLREAEEMLAAKLALLQHTDDIQGVTNRVRHIEKAWASISPILDQAYLALVQNIGDTVITYKLQDFLTGQHDKLKKIASELENLARSSENDARDVGSMVDDLLLDTKKLLMLPCSALLQGFPKMVRDISRDLGKEVDFIVEGAEVELDKRILEKLKDPLIHLVRNSIDHGIEIPEVRKAKNKSKTGTVKVTVAQVDSSNVEIIITDDGAGIDIERVKEAALKSQMPTFDEMYDDQGLLHYICQSGVSTSATITDLSGRGLGMAIVRENVEELGGIISLDTTPGVGTSFRILVPVTHTTFRGVLIKVAEQLFIVPTMNIERVWRLKSTEVVTVENRETLALNGQAVSLVHLADILEIPRKIDTKSQEYIQVIVITVAGIRIAFLVDEVLQEQEVLVKRLGKQLSRVRNIAGATILGSGDVVPIGNVRDLIKSATLGIRSYSEASIAEDNDEHHQQSILVVEDSVTSRMLLKNILEASGYKVSVAIDGIDGLTALKTDRFDLVVSDVEMPRMDGFDLTAKIRSDANLAEMPVILVTALESREHRERGIDVGANAYIVKSSFDQSNLLETVKRLI